VQKFRLEGEDLKTIRNDEQLADYSADAGIYRIKPRAVLVTESEEDLVHVMHTAEREGVPLTPRGSGTSIPSQAVGSGYIVLQRGRDVEIIGHDFKCQPSTIKADLNSFLESHGLWMPVDPSSYRACTFGGMVANNSSGPRTPKYGSTIDYVEEIGVVLPGEGKKILAPLSVEDALHGDFKTRRVASLVVENWNAILRERPRTTKNSSGYRLERLVHDGLFDLPNLFVGSEGTLGLMSWVKCRTTKKPRYRKLAVITIDALKDLDMVVKELLSLKPSAVELLDRSIFTRAKKESMLAQFGGIGGGYLVFAEMDSDDEDELDGALEMMGNSERIAQFNPILLTSSREMSRAWETRDMTLTIASEMRSGRRSPVPGIEDLVVPAEKLGALLGLLEETFARLGLEYISYGHAGDANLHVRPLLDLEEKKDRRLLDDLMRECFEAVWKMGGSITGEHGDGLLRAAYVKEQYPETYHLMTQIKQIYDPKWLMNPGVKLQRR